MSGGAVVIVRTGAANLASVVAAFARLGQSSEVTADPERVAAAGRVVLPGVGAFAPVARALAAAGLDRVVAERVAAGRPTLAICLGLQLLAVASEEGEGCPGLGLLPVTVRRFPATVVVPQLGWNRVTAGAGCRLLGELAARFGCQCTVLALDAARDGGRWRVVVRSGRDRLALDAVAWAREATARGAGEILLTSWDRDGTGVGYDLELIAAVSAAVGVPVIASGGASSAEHMAAALRAGADAVLAASILHDGETTVGALKEQLAALGQEVRR